MSDLISRQDAINVTWEEPIYTDPLNILTEIRDKLEALPSAEKTGKWIKVDDLLGFRCSKCGWEMVGTSKFCPNCGARMVGDTE